MPIPLCPNSHLMERFMENIFRQVVWESGCLACTGSLPGGLIRGSLAWFLCAAGPDITRLGTNHRYTNILTKRNTVHEQSVNMRRLRQCFVQRIRTQLWPGNLAWELVRSQFGSSLVNVVSRLDRWLGLSGEFCYAATVV